MIILEGKPVCGGIAFGKIFMFTRAESIVKRTHVESSEAEIERFRGAKRQAVDELEALYEKAMSEVGKSSAMIFRIHQMMLEDLDYTESIENIITDQLLNAETAVALTCDNFVQMFESMDDSYMRERGADVKDVSERLIRILSGKSTGVLDTDIPVIIAADDLAPSETVQFDKRKILAFVTEGGAANSHTAILARMMNIPAVIGVKELTSGGYDGKEAVIDGFSGRIYIEPDENTVRIMTKKLEEAKKQQELLKKLKGCESISKDGQKIELCANIGKAADAELAIENDAEGIGLFRSEFLYLGADDYPSEETQFEAYRDVLAKLKGRRVVIRTLDIGADKQAGYFELPHEENPAMGIRAIRICLERPEIFKTQLRALYRASVFGRLAIMFPMITSEWEVQKILSIIGEVKAELDAEGREYSDKIELGCMIETPAAAIISDVLAKYFDFFSIGTNDLTQYTLAADRQNPAIGQFCDAHHKAVLRLIKFVCDNAHRNGLWTGICGELGADMSLTEAFLAFGVDELSVTPGAILPLRKKVMETDVSKIRGELIDTLL